MNRLVRGSVMLAATLVVLAACGGDPTSDGADKPTTIVTDPSVLFVANTDSQAMTVELHNVLGQQLAADFAVTNVGAGIVVSRDDSFAVIDGNKPNPTKARFFVRPTDASSFVSTTFDVTAGGLTKTIPVKITPANLPATFSSVSVLAGDTVIATAPAPLTFTAATTVTFGALEAIVTSVSPDGSQISFIPPPGASSPGVFTGITLSFLASPQTLTSTEAITVSGTTSIYTGTDDPTTSPTLTLPAVGDSIDFYDAMTATDQFYKLVVPVATTLTITVTFDAAADVDFWACNATCSNPGTPGGFGAATGANPEQLTTTFAPGTYNLQLDLYGGSTGFVRVTIHRDS
ncbi:MAG: hypothetical protein ABI679_02290 [Gemmatimonadota bacterium]